MEDRESGVGRWSLVGLVACAMLGGCGDLGGDLSTQDSALHGGEGRRTFRYDTFGDEQLWTDRLRMHEVIASAVSPATALAVGLKVDADALPAGLLASADLNSPATTVALLKLGAVVGVVGRVDRNGTLVSVGITCALCHSTVDNSVAPGIGRRLDGWPNRDLDPGLIISLSPALSAAQKQVYQSWGAGHYDPRYNQDGISDPVLIPPAYGLRGVGLATYTGDGTISYWNNYVAVTQMGGHGDFRDPRLGLFIDQDPDRVTHKLPALREYQLSLAKPSPPPGSFDAQAAERGRVVFAGAGRCASCHAGSRYTDASVTLHAAAETGMAPLYAARSVTHRYRTTPLRGLWQHAPYFHDGSAATLADVVAHYDGRLGLGLDAGQKSDLLEFLKSL